MNHRGRNEFLHNFGGLRERFRIYSETHRNVGGMDDKVELIEYLIDGCTTGPTTVGINSGGLRSLDELLPLPEKPAITQSLRNFSRHCSMSTNASERTPPTVS